MTNRHASENRYEPSVHRAYRNDQIEVTWEPSLCIHFAACIRGSIRAFNPQRRPWIDVDAATPEELAAIVARCPSGALHARWTDGRPAEPLHEETRVLPMLDGPLFVRGRLRILDRQGNLLREDVRMAFCRCGHSQNKPFCDNSHEAYGFESQDPVFGEEPDDPEELVR